MNSIPAEQNSPLNLERLAAQRCLYSRAKRILFWQMVIGGPVTVALALLALRFPPVKALAALCGIFAAVADIAWLTPWQKRLRTLAAQVQEQFDCDVLNLPWNDVKTGKAPLPETVREEAERYHTCNTSMPSVRDWYSPQVGDVPLHIARIVCQRQNCWWDSRQRRKYAAVIVLLVVIVFICLLTVSIPTGLTVERFLVTVLAPLSPALLIGYRQVTEQLEAATRLDALREHAERFWAETLRGLSPGLSATRSRAIQDEIFDNRKRSPLIFDEIFNVLQEKNQALANHSADHYIAEARQKLRLDYDMR